jgi:hypothetical protein
MLILRLVFSIWLSFLATSFFVAFVFFGAFGEVESVLAIGWGWLLVNPVCVTITKNKNFNYC